MNKEWSDNKVFNPFNSAKLFAQVYRWEQIKRGDSIPQPALITIDPCHQCNFDCIWCNADMVRKNDCFLNDKIIDEIPIFLSQWEGSPNWKIGVEAVCIAGGGEPLLHPRLDFLINSLINKGIEVGIVTNGFFIDKFVESLSKCTWVGVSVDCATEETMIKTKRVKCFKKIISNMENLIKYSKENKTTLSKSDQGYGVSYKYLAHPENAKEIYEACKIAREIGCKNFHLRPSSAPWNKVNKEIMIPQEYVSIIKNQSKNIESLETDDFGVFSITHKFDGNLQPNNDFDHCFAIFMTMVISPSKNGFNLELCCDRRGDRNAILIDNSSDIYDIAKEWGGKKHWNIFDNIDVKKCPRCTYKPHNKIYQNAILHNNTTYKFI